jgi:hypothetical protein
VDVPHLIALPPGSHPVDIDLPDLQVLQPRLLLQVVGLGQDLVCLLLDPLDLLVGRWSLCLLHGLGVSSKRLGLLLRAYGQVTKPSMIVILAETVIIKINFLAL